MLNVNNLVKNYRDPDGNQVEILKIAHFAMQPGEQVVLRGASGGGKTTLLHIIAGILAPTSGEVIFDNKDIYTLSESGRDRYRAAKIGYVFQTFNLLDGFSALENVRLGMSFGKRKHDIHRAMNLLERVGLKDRMHHRPKQLSVGQQQRVSVARALANKPRLLLADEPTANVDPANQQLIISLMREVCQEESVALLMVTHSQEVSNQFSKVVNFEELNQVISHTAESTTG
jgi:putative ABC transport system ATP-binding protein